MQTGGLPTKHSLNTSDLYVHHPMKDSSEGQRPSVVMLSPRTTLGQGSRHLQTRRVLKQLF